MTDAVSSPGPAAGDGPDRPLDDAQVPEHAQPQDHARSPEQAQAWLSEDNLLAVLDGLGVAGTHDPEEDQEAIAAAEWEARLASDAAALTARAALSALC